MCKGWVGMSKGLLFQWASELGPAPLTHSPTCQGRSGFSGMWWVVLGGLWWFSGPTATRGGSVVDLGSTKGLWTASELSFRLLLEKLTRLWSYCLKTGAQLPISSNFLGHDGVGNNHWRFPWFSCSEEVSSQLKSNCWKDTYCMIPLMWGT